MRSRFTFVRAVAAGAIVFALFGMPDSTFALGETCNGLPVTIPAGTAGNDVINGTPGDDVIAAGSGDDQIYASDGNDTICGEDGNDVLGGEGGDDTIIGGNGFDLSFYAGAPAGVTVTLPGLASGGAGNDTLSGIENVYGSSFDDVIAGDGLSNVLTGFGGNDTIDGGGNFDTINYEEASAAVVVDLGAGTVTGGAGNDSITNVESARGSVYDDTLTGGPGNDSLTGNPGNDTIIGAGGNDATDYGTAAGPVTVDLTAGTATGADGSDSLTSIENAWGSEFGDVLTGNGANNQLRGNGGADTIDAAGGNDGVTGGGGSDTLNGGSGGDVTDYFSDPSGVNVNLTTGVATDGYGGTDSLAGFEQVNGSNFNDFIFGGPAGESFTGFAGNDTISGSGGTDLVLYNSSPAGVSVNLTTGSAGDGYGGTDSLFSIENVNGSNFNDFILGDAFNNFFFGFAGNDTLNGGPGPSDGIGYNQSPTGVNVNLATGVASDGYGGTDTVSNVEGVNGSNFDDTLTGDGFNNFLFGFAGNDAVNGGAGPGDSTSYASSPAGVNVNLAAGVASDGFGTADTLSGIEGLTASNFNDTLVGDGNSNFFTGNAGNDSIDGAGSTGDSVSYSNSPAGVSVNLATGVATDGFGSTDTLTNTEFVTGSSFADTLVGDGGNNGFTGGPGSDAIDGAGGAGDSTSYTTSAAPVNVNLGTGVASDGFGATDTLTGIEQATGSNFSDTLTGDAGNNVLTGVGGNDSMNGAGGVDTTVYAGSPTGVTVNLGSGTGTDGFGGTDTLSSIETVVGSNFNDTLTGSSADNTIIGFAGNDVLDGAGGIDIVGYAPSPAAVTVNLGTGTASDGHGTTDTLTGFEGVGGSNFNDTIIGDGGGNGITGGPGNDAIDGGGGRDSANYALSPAAVNVDLAAGTASDGFGSTDTLTSIEGMVGSAFGDNLTGDANDNDFSGNGGNDAIDGGGGTSDAALYSVAPAAVSVDLTLGTAVDGFGSTDTLVGIEAVSGSSFDDTLTGDAGTNGLAGGAGNDTITGGGGNDHLIGGPGDDHLYGGAGHDILQGGDSAGSPASPGDTGDGNGGTDLCLVGTAIRCEGTGTATGVGPGAGGGASLPPSGPTAPGVSIFASAHVFNFATTIILGTYDTPVGLPVLISAGYLSAMVSDRLLPVGETATMTVYWPSSSSDDEVALVYYDGAAWKAVKGSGGTAPVKQNTDDLDGTTSGGRFTFQLSATSSPTFAANTGGNHAIYAVALTTAAPIVTAATPAKAAIGSSITIKGQNLLTTTNVDFNGTNAPFSVHDSKTIIATVPAGATTGPVTVTAPGGTATDDFKVAPTIAAVSASTASPGDTVTITGSGLTQTTAVLFGGRPAASFTVVDDLTVTAVVPGDAKSGVVTVKTPGGNVLSDDAITIAPAITSFTPKKGPAGTVVTVNGRNFDSATVAKLGATSVAFAIVTPTQIQFTVPVGATTGLISVTNPAGTITSSTAFTVTP